jgi:hypothetical protein
MGGLQRLHDVAVGPGVCQCPQCGSAARGQQRSADGWNCCRGAEGSLTRPRRSTHDLANRPLDFLALRFPDAGAILSLRQQSNRKAAPQDPGAETYGAYSPLSSSPPLPHLHSTSDPDRGPSRRTYPSRPVRNKFHFYWIKAYIRPSSGIDLSTE